MGNSKYLLNNEQEKTATPQLVYASHSKFENDWPSLPHTHHFVELFYVVNGSGRFLIEEEEYPIRKDDYVIINPNVVHTEISSQKEPLEYITLSVKGTSFRFMDLKNHIIFNCQRTQSDLMFYMQAILSELADQNAAYEMICNDLLEVLIIKLIRHSGFSFDTKKEMPTTIECQKIKRYIESNYMHNITLDTLAEHSNMSKYYLVHAFTKYYHCSPINYLSTIRIQASKELLLNTDYRIAEVASLSGFTSQSYFSQCFLKECQMTPSAFRREKS